MGEILEIGLMVAAMQLSGFVCVALKSSSVALVPFEISCSGSIAFVKLIKLL